MLKPGVPVEPAVDPMKDDGPAIPHQRKSLLHGEDRAFAIHAKDEVEGGLRDLAQRLQRAQAGIGEQDVDPPMIRPNL